jgi:enamine deaminase RidA (YjgF/YER057c/UK114 family)
MNQIYAKCFGDHRPARTVVPTGALHYGFLIEMDVIAAIYNSEDKRDGSPTDN